MPTWIYFTPQQDAYVSEYYANSNFGNIPYLYTNLYQSAQDEYQSLIQFDLCSHPCNKVPENSNINPVKLWLKIYRNEVPSCTTVYAYRIMQPWNESTVTWNTRPMVDYSTPVGSAKVPSGDFGLLEMDLDYNVVMGWYNGYYRNYGLLLKCDEPVNSLIGFYSKEFSNPDYWPMLGICYYQSCCVETT